MFYCCFLWVLLWCTSFPSQFQVPLKPSFFVNCVHFFYLCSAKSIFEQALARVPKDKSDALFKKFIAFQKQRGEREALEKAVIDKRRIFYEEVKKIVKSLKHGCRCCALVV